MVSEDISAALALLSKETGIAVLPICIVYYIFKSSQRSYGHKRERDVNQNDYNYGKEEEERCNSNLAYYFWLYGPLIAPVITLIALLWFRIRMLHGSLPYFTSQDNPASFEEAFLTRFLTFSYLIAFNLQLLLMPNNLSYDWQMGSIPLCCERRTVFVGICFLVFPFIPASNLFVTVGFVVAERVLYVSRSGLESVPANAKIHYNYANLQKDLGNIEKAIHHYRTALSLWPTHESSHNNLGTLLLNADEAEAERHFKEALRINPYHPRPYFNLANLYSKKGLSTKAINLLKRSIELDPNFAEPYSSLASLYAEKGFNEDANILHLKALEIEPKNADLVNNYGAFLQKTGNSEEAIKQYVKALQIQPEHTIALSNLQQITKFNNLLDSNHKPLRNNS
ncbi:transmembrane and TPR repeat-containing protein 1-like protein [Dinothrombium tinctorium]|uniref:dolichyl-phosphate-mannose--protein mannosyltransferase n=1 Tax=Dinothrombium tinctorium TaxID=1965070 RepID=A0A443RPC2_9ACAR|nr:transmembrane and TPR repeat-containing protein 1-like protein [Dinothrombium tinctorium]